MSTLGSEDDAEFYTVALKYDNPGLDVEFGGLYEKQARSEGSQTALSSTFHPYRIPGAPTSTYPLHAQFPHPLSGNILDFYLKKSAGYFTFGGELGWHSGTSSGYGGSGLQDMNSWGTLLSVAYERHKIKTFMGFLYASGDSNLAAAPMTGFVSFHRNRRPGMLLGRELLGNYYGNNAGVGSLVVYGNNGSFSGVYCAHPGIRVEWSQTWASGLELIYASKATTQENEEGHLGFEIDMGTDYSIYKNFDVGVALALLIPGKGLGVSDPKSVFGFQTTFGLKF
jgi:hypothetical protein